MAYTNKKSAKRKHKKYRRRTKKGGVIYFVDHTKSNKSRQSSKREVNEADAIHGLANDYTRAALEDAVAIFSRKAQVQEQALAQAPQLTVNVHSKSRAKRQGLTPRQIKKEQEKQAKALAKQQKEEEKALAKQQEKQAKALAKQQREEAKALAKQQREEEKAAQDVTIAGIDKAFSSMFGQHYKARG
jgi:hypothetical protein